MSGKLNSPARHAAGIWSLWLLLTISIALTAQTARADAPSGLFLKSDNDHYRRAPRLSAELAVTVSGPIARAELRQRFRNTGQDWLEGIYLFPLPEDAAVDRLTLQVGDRLIEGRIDKRQTAAQTYEKAKSQGRAAALIEGERPNLFTASVANIPPESDISVHISFQTRVRWDTDHYELTLPTVVAPRYLPPLVMADLDGSAAIVDRLTDGARITPPVRVPGNGNPIEISVVLDAGLPLRRIDSTSHALQIEDLEGGRTAIRLDTGAAPADRDFALTWAPDIGVQPRPVLFDEVIGGDRYLSLMVLPPARAAGDGDGRLPRDIIFILDRSGSMHGHSIDQAKGALTTAIERLTAQDRFNIVHFSNDSAQLFPDLADATPVNRNRARNLLRRIKADGGTEMLTAIARALALPPDPERFRQIVLLTDGAVGNEAEILALVARDLGAVRLFPVAIGSAPNRYLMSRLARTGRGSVTTISDPSQTGTRMARLFRHLASPALTDLSLTLPGGGEAFPDPLADLYYGEPVMVTAKLPARAAGTLSVTGRLGDTPWRQELQLESARPYAGIGKLWARDKIRWLRERHLFDGAEDPETRITEIALRHQLVTKFTSLVAVAEDVSRPRDADLESHRIAGNLPHGWTAPKRLHAPAGAAQPAPPKMFRIKSATSSTVTLPRTATPAALWMALGMLLVILGGGLFWAIGPRGARP